MAIKIWSNVPEGDSLQKFLSHIEKNFGEVTHVKALQTKTWDGIASDGTKERVQESTVVAVIYKAHPTVNKPLDF